MPVSVTMPALGESVTEGTVTRWLKQEGEQVQADEPLLEVSTDKVDTEIPSPASGVLTRIVVSEDETVDVGTELAVIGDADDGAGGEASAGKSEDGQASAGGSDAGGDVEAGDTDAEQAADGGEAGHDGMGGDAADRAVESAAGAEEADQPSEPAQTSGGSGEEASESESGESAGRGSSSGAKGSGHSGTSVTMPALGESVTEGTVTRWLKNVGDDVAADEPLLEVSTDKVDTEIPSPVAGTLLEITVNEDETVEVGAQLATIGTASADGDPPASDDGEERPPADGDERSAADGDEQADAGGSDQPGATDDAGRSKAADKQADAGDGDQAVATGDAGPSGATDEPEGGDRPAGGGAAPDADDEQQPPQRQAKAAADQPADPQRSGQPQASPAPSAAAGPRQPAGAAGQPAQPGGDGGAAAYVTPLVRKLAAEHRVDLSTVRGTGVGGRIRKQDVLEAAKTPEPAAASQAAAGTAAPPPVTATADPAAQALRGKTEKLSRLRTVIAKRMVESLQISAQLTTVVEVDITQIARLRQRVKTDFEARDGVKLSFLPFFALAAVEALKAHPKVNSSVDMDAGTVTYHDSENLGIAVDTERGLLVPVIHGAGDLNLGGIARKIADLADRTRRNKITPDELSGGTFTLTNTGSRGALFDTPIINQPQSAILGTGTVVKRPVVVEHPDLGEVVTVRSMIYLALSYDHRIVDGADAARFLVSMKQRLEAGDFESALGLG